MVIFKMTIPIMVLQMYIDQISYVILERSQIKDNKSTNADNFKSDVTNLKILYF